MKIHIRDEKTIFNYYRSYFFLSCKKNSDVTTVNTISATIDGVTESFNNITIANISTGPQPRSILSISGSDGSTSGSNSVSLSINSNVTLTNGSYANDGKSSGAITLACSFGPYSIAKPNAYFTDPNGKYPGTIVITAINATNIQGTFSGTPVLTNGTTIKTITNGKFNVNFK